MLNLAEIITKTRENVIHGIAEAQAAGVPVLPPTSISIQIGMSHGDKGFRVADFNDVSVARVALSVELFATTKEYEAAINAAIGSLEDRKAKEAAAGTDAFNGPDPAKKLESKPKK